MSSAHPHTAKLSKSELADLLAEALANPKVKARLAKPYKLVTSYDIALLGSSSIGGENVYLDRHLREGKAPFGVLTVAGRKLDVKPGLVRHERLEQALEDIFGWSYEIAHEVATAYEEQLYRAKGFDPRKVEAAFEPYIKKDEGENIVRTPTDLDMRPMLGDKKLLARVKAATEKEKKTHESVGYVAKSNKPNQSCGKCKMFIRPEYGGPCCTLVKSPITAGGWCRRFWAGTLGYAQGGRVKGYADGGDAQEYWGEGLPPSQMRQAPIAEDIGRGIVNTAVGLVTLPQRALEASEGLRYGLPYDPGPAVEAATLPMTGGLAAPVGLRAGEAALGAGPVRGARPQIQGLRDIRPPKEDIYETADANFMHGKPVGNDVAPIDSLTGGTRESSPFDAAHVKKLASQISGPEGFWERPIVDDVGNVVEGQHRIDAARMLGMTDVPVYRIKDLERGLPVDEMRRAITGAGLHPDQAHGVLRRALEAIDEAGSPQAALEYELPGPLNKPFQAALTAAQTRNYVLFRDDIIDIIKKYGIAGLMALPPSTRMMLDRESQ